ncbi:hypothetical protein D3C85_1376390 [compost metagenome]
MYGGGNRGLKKPGWPENRAGKAETCPFMAGEPKPKGMPSNSPASESPQGTEAKPAGRQMLSQKPRRRSMRSSSREPAMMAALMDPMEMPEIQLGRMPASCKPW